MGQIGRRCYPDATRLLISADGGGSNGYRVRLWKIELAAFAAETGLDITVCHLPPGHQQMEQNRAPAVLPHLDELARTTTEEPRMIVDLIGNHHTTPGSPSTPNSTPTTYPTGIKITDGQRR